MLRREFRASDLSCCESGFGGFKKKRVAGESQKKERNLPNIVKNVLVTMGGSDPDNVTLKVIEVLKKLDVPGLHVKVIVGPANPHLEALQQAASSSDISCELISSVRDMPSLMQRADLAISAAGSTCWEFCCLGVPLMTIILAENQVGLSGRLEKSGASKNMGWHYQIDSRECLEDIRSFLDNEVLQKNLSAHARKLVDGGGNFRIIETINGG
jgi:spore coat polysaccharide biosynthesis predicted glycosyltransferase SpsG